MILSLFSGCGGLDLGFERAGFAVGLAYDAHRHPVASWNHNRRGGKPRAHVADVMAIDPAAMDRHYGATFRPVGVIGGPPCQSFSRANRSPAGARDGARLVSRFFSLALALHSQRRPLDFILMENVPDIQSARHEEILAHESRQLENRGFNVYPCVLDAVQFGVPQYRKRLFLLAVSKRFKAVEPWPPPPVSAPAVTVGDAIVGLPRPTQYRRGLTAEDIPYHPNHLCMKPKSAKFFDGSLKPGYTSGRSFKTLSEDSPSVTVSYGHREVHVHPSCGRRLSVLESMILQGFPESYQLIGSLSSQIEQISQAVPPPLAQAIANAIRPLVEANDTINQDL